MNSRLKAGFGIVAVGGAMLAQAAVTPEVVDQEWRMTVAKGCTETLTDDQVQDLKDKFAAGTVTVFRKLGEGTLEGIALTGYTGPIIVSEGIYSITSPSCLGTTAGSTTVESGASLMINGKQLDFTQEHLILSGNGYDDKGVLRVITADGLNNNILVSRVTMNADCLFAADSGCKQGFTLSNTGSNFDMNGHTLTLNPGGNTLMQLTHIVNPGHFVNLHNEFWIHSAAILDHGPEHTITIGGSDSSADISFWNNPCTSHQYNWKIVYANGNSSLGITGNMGWKWYGPIEICDGVSAKFNAGINGIDVYGNLMGAGNITGPGKSLLLRLHGDNTAFTGQITTTAPVYAYTEASCTGITQVTDGYLYWPVRGEGETVGFTTDELRDTIFPKYQTTARKFGFGITAGTTYTYPYDFPLSDTMISAYCANGGTLAFTSALQPGDTYGSFWYGTFLAQGPEGVVDLGTMNVYEASFTFTNIVAKGIAGKRISVNSAANATTPTELVFEKDARLNAAEAGSAFQVGSNSSVPAAKSVLEFRAGSAVTNDFSLGVQAQSSSAGAAAAVYVRPGAYLRIKRNTGNGFGDTTIGYTSQGFLEQTGGTVVIDMYSQFGRASTGYGQHYISGGTCTTGQGYHMPQIGRGCYYQTGGTFSSSSRIVVCDCSYTDATTAGSVGDLTLDGANANMSVVYVTMAQRNGCTATVNINNGATLKAQRIVRAGYGSDYTTYKELYVNDRAYVNFNGGIFECSSTSQDVFGKENGATSEAGAKTNTWPTAVTIFPKGATLRVNGTSEARVSAPLRAPIGRGVTSIPLPDGITSDLYVAPPKILITGDGTNATAVATIDTVAKRVTGIVVTSPGWGYTNAKATLSLGGQNKSYTVTCTLGDVTGGGLTKTGTGTLTLQATNTYTGATTVDAGTLKLAAGSAIPTASPIVVAAGATLEIANGQTNFVSITGGGTVKGSYTPQTFVADFDNAGAETPAIPHTVGTLALNGQTVSFANVPDPMVRSTIPIATATSFTGDVASLQVEPGVLPETWRTKFVVTTAGDVSTLKLRVRPPKQGLVILYY